VRSGERSAASVRSVIDPMLAAVQVEYFSLVDPDTLAPVERITGPVLIAAAIWIGKTRLIDNVTVSL